MFTRTYFIAFKIKLLHSIKIFSSVIVAIPSVFMDVTFNVPMLNDNNFSDWKENLLLTLRCLELDLALRVDEPLALTEKSMPLEIAKHEW
jgi:hypothetical protein